MRFKKSFNLIWFLLICLVAVSQVHAKMVVGDEVIEVIETDHPYIAGTGVIWEETFHMAQASYIAIHFSHFQLADGDYVTVTSDDGFYSYMYEGGGKKINNGQVISEFWATHIPRDTVIVRLHSENGDNDWGVRIDKWVHGYEKPVIEELMAEMEYSQGQESICSNDDKEWAKCYEGTTMYNKAKAVIRLLINGGIGCTGWLLGSEGHVMTNEHCIESSSDANNTDYEFMAEGATCQTDCFGWKACPGVVEASSGTLVKINPILDYSLILLPINLTTKYGYMQFRETLPSIGERIYIPQHPAFWGKQLAVLSDVDGPNASIYSLNEYPCTGIGPGDIGYYADTFGGSSGSPVIAYDDNLVVALHHCSDCPNRGVPIPAIISDLGSDIPNDAIGQTGPVETPVANFIASSTGINVGQSVTFADMSSNNPTSWFWTFEGGTPSSSTAQKPTVTYNSEGIFDVNLIVENSAGSDNETKTEYITVLDSGIQYCNASGNNQNFEYIAGVQVADLNNTSGASGYSDFTAQTAHLTAGSSVNVTLTPGYANAPYTEYWRIWADLNHDDDFEDVGEKLFEGYGSSQVNGTITVPATATDGNTRMRVSMRYGGYPNACGSITYGEVEDYTLSVGASNPQPEAAFSYTVDMLTVTFSDESTAPGDNDVVDWQWDFGDGGMSDIQDPVYTYAAAGTYTVNLTVTDDNGLSDSVSKAVTVGDSLDHCDSAGQNQNYEWIAGVTLGGFSNSSGASKYSDFTNKVIEVDKGTATALTLTPGFTGASYTENWRIWADLNGDGDFGDTGELLFQGSGASPVNGTITVPATAADGNTRLRVSMRFGSYPNACGSFNDGEVEDYTLSVGASNPQPEAAFSYTVDMLTVTFSDESTAPGDSYVDGWLWDFGDGVTSSDQNPDHSYAAAGNYTVNLTVTDDNGLSDGVSKTVTVGDSLDHCDSAGQNQNYEWIAGVTLGGFSNGSGASGYSDFTNKVIEVYKGAATALTLTPGFASSFYTEYWRIWADLNDDGDFGDTGELLFQGIGASPVNGTIMVPATAANGNTRLRVSMRYGSYPNACGSFSDGEVEDYTIQIQ